MSFKSPDELFLAGKTKILHQDKALFALAVPLYYHLRLLNLYLKKDTKDQKRGQGTGVCVLDDGDDGRPRFATLDNLPVIPQQTIFITGKTGSGKTHLVKVLCQMAGVNFLAVNATHISNSGYKGMTLADIGEMLSERAKSPRHAEFSVLFLDEFDKLFVDNSTSVGEWHRAVATELLTIMEGTTDFPVKDKLSIPSRHMLFILGGSFEMHKDTRPPMGFLGKPTNQDTPKAQLDFSEFGLPDELAGRIGRIVGMEVLDDEMLKDILLNSPSSPFRAFGSQIGLEYCTVSLDDGLLDELMVEASDAIDKFGVRGLYQAFNQLPQISEVLADAPTSRYHHYVLTPDGYTKTYQKDYRPTPKITIHVQPTPAPPTKADDDWSDDMPF